MNEKIKHACGLAIELIFAGTFAGIGLAIGVGAGVGLIKFLGSL